MLDDKELEAKQVVVLLLKMARHMIWYDKRVCPVTKLNGCGWERWIAAVGLDLHLSLGSMILQKY